MLFTFNDEKHLLRGSKCRISSYKRRASNKRCPLIRAAPQNTALIRNMAKI